MAGYTRVDTINNIADGNVINAADLDGEFDGIQSAFNASTGHNHDGTAGEGAPILALGPTQNVTISASVLGVATTNTVDIGTSSLKFKDFYLAGAASIGGTLGVTGATTLSAALTYGGVTLSNAVTGTGNMVLSASPTLTGTITAAAANFSGAVALNNNITIGNADTDTITQSASYVAGTQLKSAQTATNTLNLAAYDTDGVAYTNLITLTASTTPTLALTSTGVGTINNMSIGATTTSTGAFTTLTASGATTLNGNTTIGDAAADTITVNGQFVTGTQLKSAQTATNTLNLAAYDVDGTAYTNLITLTAANAPTLALTSTGVGTINNMSIGATTAATGAFTTVGIGTTSPLVNLEVAGSNESTWSATLTTISGTTLTIGGAVTGTIAIGDLIYASGIQPYTRITAGSGLSWTVSVSQTLTSTTVVGGATYGNTLIRITDTDTGQAAGQPTGGLQFFTSDSSAPTAGVGAYVAALAESATPDTALVFGTRDNGGGGVDANERMRIDSAGIVQVENTFRSVSTTITGTAGGTITPTSATTNQYTITALGAAATIAIPSGTPIDGQKLTIRIKDNGTARVLTWTTSAGGYRIIGTTLPATTVISKTAYIGCVYNSADSFWDVVAVAQQA